MIDVLVAGGGPAGLATAINAALAGMEAVVVEPRPGPVDKACGEGLMPTGAAALANLGVAMPDGRPFRGIRYVDGPQRVQAEFRDGQGLGVRRTALHTALALRARDLGVRVVPGRVDAVRAAGEGVRAHVTGGPDLSAPELGGREFDARWLVAADGLHSPIRARLGLDLPSGGPRRYGLRRHYRIAPWTDFVEVHWAPGGEAYVTPVGDDLVGVAVLSSERRTYDEHLARFPDLLARLDGPPATPVRGAGPLRQRVRRRVAGRILLVGDAAGYVDALTGEGISLALLSARALVGCLKVGRPEEYETAWRRLSWRSRLLTAALVRARRHPPAARMIVPAARRLPAVFGAAVRSLA
ncbi:NAD(P)/FAD-dependent oxidoreductase [Microbispora bryophytorum]|uniref:NAD(P)/FAD-dependent oxidoreductase n=1 Tax=Microbispora bryophytorum subsp. camponoti TaxID=1677852 RepID=A0ABR8L3I6_9ACTN|nr:NAD(P)/FAD-dependent oxidoreductase [Microbispora camponoti]MBD3145518.1 NAD(P)/FAD-dependent oxidoreductase [Microbispora camponoti]